MSERETRLVSLPKEVFDQLESHLSPDCKFRSKEYFHSLMFYTPDGKKIIFSEEGIAMAPTDKLEGS